MNLFKRILPDIVVIILFAVISFAYFFPAVTEGRILSQHDSVAGIGAGEEAKEYLERTGERTRWTNSIFGGMPTYQMAPSYDSTDTLKGVEKLYHLYLPNYVWYVFVMLLGFYILLRAFDFSVWLASLGAVFGTDEIFERVWHEKFYEANNTVMVHIRRLRGKMKDDTREDKIITTVWGVGYKIEA